MKLLPAQAPTGSPDGDPDPLDEEELWLRCVACGHRVVRPSARIEVNGAHEHAFMNPSGLRFRVRCYADAPGCVAEGGRSTVWTWFPGFAWQIELCAACGAHVGWSFHGAAGSFHALVDDRVA